MTLRSPATYAFGMDEVYCRKVWRNGEMIGWDEAHVHVASHAVHYGTSFFEGIRCYRTRRGPEVFRLGDHVRRLFDSCTIYRTPLSYSPAEIEEAVLQTIRANRFEHCYIRPIVIRGRGPLAVNPIPNEVDTYILSWEWGSYLGPEALEKGVKACVASWSRAAPNTYPTIAKAAGNYLNSALVAMEAESRGYQEGIALDVAGLVSEGSGENLFLIRDEIIYTPSITNAILPGITRASIITLAAELGYRIEVGPIARESLYLADELFFTGTAAEVTPIRSVDDIPIGAGLRGPVTTRLQRAFFEIVEGRVDDRHGWLTPVELVREQVSKSEPAMG